MRIEIPDKFFTEEELRNTPKRYAKFLEEWLVKDQQFELTTFSNKEDYKEIIIISGETFSMCSHHLLPMILNYWVAYIPDKKIVGLSKIPRVINKFAHMPQLQERITKQVVNYLQRELQPQGVMCVIRGRHLCMIARGIKTNGEMTTSAITGVFKNPPKGLNPREEVLRLISNGDRK